MSNIYTNEFVVHVADQNPVVRISEEVNTVQIVDYGTPVTLNYGDPLFLYGGDHWYANVKVATKGYGERFGSSYKPIFIFEDNIQKFTLDGYARILADGSNDPFRITAQNNSNIFKITSDEIAVFKVHTTPKTAVAGGLLFYNGDLFFGV